MTANQVTLLNPYRVLFRKKPTHRYTVITGGRGSAKSFHVNTFATKLTYQPDEVILFSRYTMASAEQSIIPEFKQKISLFQLEDDFTVTKTNITNKHSGSYIRFSGIKTSEGIQTAKLKSIHGLSCFIVDEAEEFTDEDQFEAINLSIRTTAAHNRIIIVMNPSHRKHWVYKRFIETGACEHIHTTYLHNLENLSADFIAEAENMKRLNYARYAHLFLGEWRDDVEGLLWTKEVIQACKVEPVDYVFTKRIIAIDPAVTANPDSDETGIIVMGQDQAGTVYVLKDYSGRYSPSQWGNLVRQICESEKITYIVAEKNQGGDLVEANLRNSGVNNRIKLVTATKGKYVRAEPVYTLYEQGRVKHLPGLARLEDQMLAFNPAMNEESPDRVDALVWGVTDLAIRKKVIGAA